MLKPELISSNHEDLFLQRYTLLRGWAMRLTGKDAQQAEDLLHDAFIHFVIHHPPLEEIRNLEAYLHTMLRNLHLSQSRRAARSAHGHFVILDYDSAAAGWYGTDPRDQIKAQDELRAICEYACLRKESSKSGSVLILRFFHGYYPDEIVQVMRSTRSSVDHQLKFARSEARVYLQNPQGLMFMQKRAEEASRIEFGLIKDNILESLRQAIFQSNSAKCLSAAKLRELYEGEAVTPVDCATLAHIVSCPSCLESANKLLGLPSLAQRDAGGSLNRKSRTKGDGGGGDSAGGGGAVATFARESRRRMKRVLKYSPQELHISVNGFILGSQRISSEVSDLTLNVSLDEKIGFIEVFSESDLRLFFLSIESPPEGPVEQLSRVELSDNRLLEVALNFSDTWPKLYLVYHDPSLAPASGVEALGVERQSQKLGSELEVKETPALQGTTRNLTRRLNKLKAHLSSFVQPMREALLRPAFWLRPGTVTALVMLLLVASVLLIYRRGPVPAVTAASLLQKAALAEEALAANRDQVLRRAISLEEKNANGELIAQRQVEVWQSAERGITARRLYDQKGLLVAGDWRRANGVQTLYHHGTKPQLQLSPEKRHMAGSIITFSNAWQLSPSAREFTALIATLDAAHFEERGSSYILTYQNEVANKAHQGLIRATLTLGKTDLHATEQTLVLRQGSEERTFRFLETSFERRPLSAVAPSVFEPEPELLSSATPDTRHPTPEAASPLPLGPSPILATPELEVEVLRLLNSAGGDLSDQVSVTRTSDGRLYIGGTVETANRKREILRALSSVANHPAVKISLESITEAEQRQRQSGTETPKTIELQQMQIARAALPIEPELRRYFAGRGLSSEQLEQEITRFASRAMRRSLQTLLYVRTLKQAINRFSPDELRTLTPEARQKLMTLIREQAGSLHREILASRNELQAIVPVNGHPAEQLDIANDADLLRAINRLVELVSQCHESIRASFTVSSEGSANAPVRDAQFWRSLKSAEALAARISRL